ncbi:pyridine nucleotide-disulfide oxidoreductase/dicluster-binding protein [Desulfolutivibrio sulfoxidireducens]|uniref:pyridine nucleotide-disulfide oxidoreductase/dicluster-binding protein n=1 Tax=Desulfolutivibrio sulfoxidireducens TaxID=2773299 RepID=UPI00159DF688|nr:pyridine nucleotide-disulfide oxidoreductase/dicluster-binding protein [Desulfolutivibrio sulfoxidireducens]QLA15490.1 [Fe-S]-binding protein [Desulfolutivibrio sulfoxidireducens]
MEQSELRDWEARCIQEEPPACRAACPLHVDVRAFMEAMAAGKTVAARKVLERTMPLPGVLARICDHPCEAACLRRDLGGSLAVGELERFCARNAPPGPKPLVLPAKGKRAAVLGAGLAALTVAWDLARKGYGVTVSFQDDAPGGRLRDLPSTLLPPEVLAAEVAMLARMGVAFAPATVLDAAFLASARTDFDAVFVEYGAGAIPGKARGLCPDSRDAVDQITLSASDPGLCFGGWPGPDGAFSPMGCAADGRRAASTMDRILSGVSLTASREKEGPTPTRLFTQTSHVPAAPWTVPADPAGGLTPAEAVAEAGRCLSCECLECIKVCAYLKRYQGYPKTYARRFYNNAAIVKGHHQANKMINSCSLCGLCTEVCPESFSMADLCLTARRDMVERGTMPPSAFEFALTDMAESDSEACALAMPAPGAGSCGHLFFPGCQLAGASPDKVRLVYDHLRGKLPGGVGIRLGCCGVPGRWAGREDLFAASMARFRADWEGLGRPRVVAACATCLKTLTEAVPDIPAVSLWRVLAGETGLPGGAPCAEAEKRTLAVHDPCTSRHDAQSRAAVRDLLSRLGVTALEPPLTGRFTECCGYGGLMWNADPDMAKTVAERRADVAPGDYVVSCAMCRDMLWRAGNRAVHLLDLIFPGPGGPGGPELAAPAGLSARRRNRAALRRDMAREIFGIKEEAMEAQDGFAVTIAPEVLALLEERRILDVDVRAVVARAEATGEKFLDKATGRYLAAARRGNVTFWVLYDGRAGTFTVYDAYCHRMDVPGASQGPDARTDQRGEDRP